MDKSTKEAWTGDKNLSSEALEKRKAINKKIIKFGCLPIIIFGVILFLIISSSDDEVKENEVQVDNNSISEQVEAEQTPEKLNEQLKRELASFEEPFDNSTYNGTVESIQMELVLFGAWANIIKEGENSSLEENIKLAEQIKDKVVNIQIKEFPIMRKRYAKIIADKMWEHDIYIKSSGKNNTVLECTGGIFAANKNIKEFQINLQEALKMFRFKQTRYRWYKGDNEYTYYDMEVPSDKELVSFKN